MEWPLRSQVRCSECEALGRELLDGWRADQRTLRRRLKEMGNAAEREAAEFAFRWVLSVIQMPDDEMRALLDAHYPTLTRVRRRLDDHEAATGHHVSLHGLWAARSYFGFSDLE